jgi:hypothetical protein
MNMINLSWGMAIIIIILLRDGLKRIINLGLRPELDILKVVGYWKFILRNLGFIYIRGTLLLIRRLNMEKFCKEEEDFV